MKRGGIQASVVLIPLKGFSTLRPTVPRGFLLRDSPTTQAPRPLVYARVSCHISLLCSEPTGGSHSGLLDGVQAFGHTPRSAPPASSSANLPTHPIKPPRALQMRLFFLPSRPLSAEAQRNATSTRQPSLPAHLPALTMFQKRTSRALANTSNIPLWGQRPCPFPLMSRGLAHTGCSINVCRLNKGIKE